jgi:crossover junction endodeoxyribonuclease RuvC
MLRVLGVDPGSRVTGYGIVDEGEDKLSSPVWGVIQPSRDSAIQVRLDHIHSHLLCIIDDWSPECVAIEEPFVGKNPRTIFALGQAQAIVLLAGAQRGLPIFRYAPAQTKRAVADYGNATKDQVNDMVRLMLGLGVEIPYQDASDALAVALCHLQHLRYESVLDREIAQQLKEARR